LSRRICTKATQTANICVSTNVLLQDSISRIPSVLLSDEISRIWDANYRIFASARTPTKFTKETNISKLKEPNYGLSRNEIFVYFGAARTP
jgi:hypothetical protein